jgi:hypothetical protein
MSFIKNSILLLLLVFSSVLSASTKILIFGDFGTGDGNQKLVAQDMHNYCKKKGCDFAITTGDNIYTRGVENLLNNKADYDHGKPNYKIINDVFVKNYKELRIPFYMTFGNHDIGNEGIISILKDLIQNQSTINKRTLNIMLNQINYTQHNDNPVVTNSAGKASRLWTFPSSFYDQAEKENIHIWSINTNTYPHQALKDKKVEINNSKNSKQELWLKKSLERSKNSAWKIVFGHMPLYSHGRHGWRDFMAIKKFRKSIVGLLCEEKVDFYLAGHDHHLEIDRHMCPNGHIITAVISGAAAKADRIYARSFPFFSDDKNLIWGNGKAYKNSKRIYKSDDKVLGFAHLSLEPNKALLHMRLSQGASAERNNACFEIQKGKTPIIKPCPSKI